MEETPSRSVSNRFTKMTLSSTNRNKKPGGFDLDDSFDSSFESNASPFIRQSAGRDIDLDFSPLTQGGSISEFFPRSKSIPLLKRSMAVDDDDVFDDDDEFETKENDEAEKITGLLELKNDSNLRSKRKRVLSSLSSFDISQPKPARTRLNGTTPVKLNTSHDVMNMKIQNSNLIGDLSSEHALRLTAGSRGKFKYISKETLLNYIRNGHPLIEHLNIIDSRYQYEFDGGHIKGAINIPSAGSNRAATEAILSKFMNDQPQFSLTKRRVMVFHCEFSSERGPKMYEIFRDLDRKRNIYPTLIWPELYLLKGGYKEFWESFKSDKNLYGIHGYTAMMDKEAELNEVRRLRRKAHTAPSSFRQIGKK